MSDYLEVPDDEETDEIEVEFVPDPEFLAAINA